MRLGDIFIISKGTKVVLAVTVSVSLLAIAFAFIYYRNLNRQQDPRISKARELLAEYDMLSGGIDSYTKFSYLDSADAIFRSFPDYRTSFETGVIYNNKCSAILMIALYDSTISRSEKENLLGLALNYCDSSIMVYRRWIAEWDGLPYESISEKVMIHMNGNDPCFEGLSFEKILHRRINNIITAQLETPRRLSVSLSNKGTIHRHLTSTDSALVFYNQALALWPENRTAENNLSVLMGGEPVKTSLIESLFPPDKNKR